MRKLWILIAVAVLVVPGVASAKKGGGKGNSGTIKIDAAPYDDHPDNEPHAGCTFEVDLTGFSASDSDVDVEFRGQKPTGGGLLLSDAFVMSGGAASAEFSLGAALEGVDPHPKQGWHVKVAVSVDGKNAKHKTFWVLDCEAAPLPPPPPPPIPR